MLYISNWEYDLADAKKVIEFSMKFTELQKKEPEKFAKVIAGPYVLGGCGKGFTIVEADNADQLGRMCAYWTQVPSMRMHSVPIFEASRQIQLKLEGDEAFK